jgi:hypothetical protein
MELNINFIYYYLRQVITGSNQGESQAQQITELITKRKKKTKTSKMHGYALYVGWAFSPISIRSRGG